MKDQLSVIFIGGLSNGKIIYDYLNKNRYVNISLVITYSDTYQGARHTILGDGPKFRKKNTVKDCIHAIKDLAPDLIIVAGWSELIPNEILSIPRMGVIGFHPAKLPFDRGRSVLAWQIEDGYTETSLTMFKYSDYPDGGDILAQETIAIASNDYINDILDKVDAASLNLIRAYFPLLRKGFLKGVKQDLSVGSFRRLRSADDSIIKWDRNSVEIYNKIRAISHPYPGATTKFDDKTMLVWKSEIISSFPFPVDTVCEPKYLGTMGSIRFVEQFHNDTILVMNSDLFTDIDYEDFYLHFKQNNADMSVAAVPYTVSVPYGIMDLEGRALKGMIEKPTYNYYANAGIYLIKRELLELIPEDTFYNATDLIDDLVRIGKSIIRYPINGTWIDIGNPQEYQKAKDLVRHMKG